VPGVHPADSERVDPGLPKSIQKKTLHKISRFSHTSAGPERLQLVVCGFKRRLKS